MGVGEKWMVGVLDVVGVGKKNFRKCWVRGIPATEERGNQLLPSKLRVRVLEKQRFSGW